MTVTTATELWRMSAMDLAEAIRSRQVSSLEVIEAHLRRIEAVNPAVNAITVVLAEQALDAAKAADRALAGGVALPPFHGVPFTVKGNIDVVVCDGFVGNILLKFGEGIPAFFKAKFTAFASTSLSRKLTALLARSGLRSVMKELDYQEHGGVPLLGVNGVSIIGHGGSTAKAIKNMIFRAEEMVLRKVNRGIQNEMQRYS